MLTSELHYSQSSKQETEGIKYVSKPGAMSYNKFGHVPLISVEEAKHYKVRNH